MKNLGLILLIIPFIGFGQNDSLNQKRDSVLLNLTTFPNSSQLQNPESQRLFRPGVPSLDTRNGKPLFVIDGIVKEKIYSLEEIDQDQITKVTELKGVSATALYGEKGRNGVYIIETKNSILNKLGNQIPRIEITSNGIPEIIPIDSIYVPNRQGFNGTVTHKLRKKFPNPDLVIDGEYVSFEMGRHIDTDNIKTIRFEKSGSAGIILVETYHGFPDYDLTVLDLGYESFLAMQPVAATYSLDYLENKNKHYVSVWNSRAISGNKDIYEMPIDYDSRTYYGLEFEYKLFMFFKFMENKHKISFI